ncbi:MAG: RHS repeat-associated core domain-containing protein, partial [Bacteroidota bacterium]
PQIGVEHPFKFNHVELQSDFGLNLYATNYRLLDIQLGRWTGIDPRAEQAPALSPFNFCFNNPVQLRDPGGDWPWIVPVIAFIYETYTATRAVRTGYTIFQTARTLFSAAEASQAITVNPTVLTVSTAHIADLNGEVVEGTDPSYVGPPPPISGTIPQLQLDVTVPPEGLAQPVIVPGPKASEQEVVREVLDDGGAGSLFGQLYDYMRAKGGPNVERGGSDTWRTPEKLNVEKGGGASTVELSFADQWRIQRMADRHNVAISLVGSRAKVGQSAEDWSDYDFIIHTREMNSWMRRDLLYRLPKREGKIWNSAQKPKIEVSTETEFPMDSNQPHVTFKPSYWK